MMGTGGSGVCKKGPMSLGGGGKLLRAWVLAVLIEAATWVRFGI